MFDPPNDASTRNRRTSNTTLAGNELETYPLHLLTEQFQSLLLGGHVAELNTAELYVVRVLHPR